MHSTIAVIFDFDDTLLPDSTTAILSEYGIDPGKFWREDARTLIEQGYDPAHAYLRLLLGNIGDGKPFGNLTNAMLRDFGKKIERSFFPGVPTLFRDLRRFVKDNAADIDIEFYVVSGGLQDVIEGCTLITQNFRGVYGCLLGSDVPEGPLKYIKRCVTFTEKTRFLFEINKGLKPADTQKNPYLVNKDIPHVQRRVPFKNMIYVGDGLTDIPCFSLVKNMGGTPFGVFKGDSESAKQALLEFLNPGRVISMHTPRYRNSDDFGTMLRAAVATRVAQIKLDRQTAES